MIQSWSQRKFRRWNCTVPGTWKANEQNKVVYREFRTSQKGLNLLVEHEVLIASSKPGSKRIHVGRVREVFNHSVNLMDVSVRIIASCSGISYNELRELDVLASNKYSLYIVYTMAIALRQMLTNREVYSSGDVVDKSWSREATWLRNFIFTQSKFDYKYYFDIVRNTGKLCCIAWLAIFLRSACNNGASGDSELAPVEITDIDT